MKRLYGFAVALALAIFAPLLHADPLAALPLLGLGGFVVQSGDQFNPVTAGSKAIMKVPRYANTLTRVQLRLGGTTLTKAYLTEIWVRVGAHAIWETTGSDLDAMNKYKGLYDEDNHLTLDFTDRDMTDIVAKEIGGIDMSKLSDDVYIEVKISSSASAPTLKAKLFLTPPQGNDAAGGENQLVKKVVKVTTSTLSTSWQTVNWDPKRALLQRIFMFYTGTGWQAGTASSSAGAGNTGNGTMGTITASNGAQVGAYRLMIIEPGANVGTFLIEGPDGKILATRGVVASAYSAHGLAFTLADGATDFVAGDVFTITVAETTDGNVNSVRVKKNGVPIYDEVACSDARFLQKEYRKVPQDKLYVVDFIVDNNASGAVVTADARSLQIQPNLTASDTLTLYFEVLDTPYNL